MNRTLAATWRRSILSTLPLMLALGVLLAWGGREVAFGSSDVHVDKAAQQAQWTQELVEQQVTALGCDHVKRLSPNVAVVPAPVKGQHVFDTAVVTVVPFDAAFAQAKAGRVWVVGWCG